jgi:predicted  nucleic acid-binding Zn-ribbon protein
MTGQNKENKGVGASVSTPPEQGAGKDGGLNDRIMDYKTERILRDILDRVERLERYVYGRRGEEGIREYTDRELSNLNERLNALIEHIKIEHGGNYLKNLKILVEHERRIREQKEERDD